MSENEQRPLCCFVQGYCSRWRVERFSWCYNKLPRLCLSQKYHVKLYIGILHSYYIDYNYFFNSPDYAHLFMRFTGKHFWRFVQSDSDNSPTLREIHREIFNIHQLVQADKIPNLTSFWWTVHTLCGQATPCHGSLIQQTHTRQLKCKYATSVALFTQNSRWK